MNGNRVELLASQVYERELAVAENSPAYLPHEQEQVSRDIITRPDVLIGQRGARGRDHTFASFPYEDRFSRLFKLLCLWESAG